MKNANLLFDFTQITDATYTSFNNKTGNDTSIKLGLQGKPDKDKTGGAFSEKQAEEFLKHWRVVDQYATGSLKEDPLLSWFISSGFSSTLFERLDERGSATGQFTFAVRGSIGLNNFSADTALIAKNGVAEAQLVDMYNCWQKTQ